MRTQPPVVPALGPLLAAAVAAALQPSCTREPMAAARARRAIDEPLVAAQVPMLGAADAGVGAPRPLSGIMQRAVVGGVFRGELRAGDTALPENGGALCDEFVVQLTAGQPVTIFARGGASRTTPGTSMDMYLYLRLRGTELMRDDDSAASNGVLDSRIQYVPSETGLYVIRVSTYGSAAREGDYWLQVVPGVVAEPPAIPGGPQGGGSEGI